MLVIADYHRTVKHWVRSGKKCWENQRILTKKRRKFNA